MNQLNYFDGYIYHMVHFDNLPSIFEQNALLSKEILDQKGIVPRSIALDEVQKLRHRIFVLDLFERKYYNLHRYVPFYFAKKPPMLHVRYKDGIQNDIVIFKVSRAVIQERGVVFTDGNATIQQLSHDDQRVGIIPTTVSGGLCRRIYRPDSDPHGTNANCSNFYGDAELLDRIEWDVIMGTRFVDDKVEYRRIKSAEVLVPDQLPLEKIQGIAVSTKQMVKKVNELIDGEGLAEYIPAARVDSSLFL